MANVLPKAKQVAVIRALVDGVGVRATERITDTSRETVLSLLVRVGEGCAALHDRLVRNLACERIECDELWGFVQKKLRWVTDADPADYGDTWTWTALDPDSKLVAAYRIGKRDAAVCNGFLADLASRLVLDQRTDLPCASRSARTASGYTWTRSNAPSAAWSTTPRS